MKFIVFVLCPLKSSIIFYFIPKTCWLNPLKFYCTTHCTQGADAIFNIAVTRCCYWKQTQLLTSWCSDTIYHFPDIHRPWGCSTPGLLQLERFEHIIFETWTRRWRGGGTGVGGHRSKSLALVRHCAKYQQFPQDTPDAGVRSQSLSRLALLSRSVPPQGARRSPFMMTVKPEYIILKLQWVPMLFIFT